MPQLTHYQIRARRKLLRREGLPFSVDAASFLADRVLIASVSNSEGHFIAKECGVVFDAAWREYHERVPQPRTASDQEIAVAGEIAEAQRRIVAERAK